MTAIPNRMASQIRVFAMSRNWEIGQYILAGMLTICLAISSVLQPALATPLDEDSCQRLRTEKKALTVLGIDKYFERGAEWVKTNLTSADYNLVKRYVNVFELLKFRCPAEPVKNATIKAYNGPVPPMPVRSPRRIERAVIPAKAAKPG